MPSPTPEPIPTVGLNEVKDSPVAISLSDAPAGDRNFVNKSIIRGAGLSEEPHRKVRRILYIFAGRERQSDIKSYLQQIFKDRFREEVLEVVELDIKRDLAHDLMNDVLYQKLLGEVARGKYDFILASPPCETWSRALFANRNGPRPLRDSRHPWGFPWLEGESFQKCFIGSELVRRTLAILRATIGTNTGWLLEHPEDLGVRKNQRDPASIWPLEPTRDLVKDTDGETAACLQCHFEATEKKPTRWAGKAVGMKKIGPLGWPTFSKHRRYRGSPPPYLR